MRKTTLIFIILSGVASFFNYVVYPILARLLSSIEFVHIATALALFTQLSSFMLSIVALTIGLSKQTGQSDSKATVEKLQALLTHLFLVIIVIFLAASPLYLGRLHMPAQLLLPICAMLALSMSMSVISGYLNGKQKLVKLGLAIAFSSFLQLGLSVIFAIITKSGTTALNGMALGSFIAIVLIYQVYKAEKLPSLSSIFSHGLSLYRTKSIRSLVKFTIMASLTTLLMNILLIIDLLIVNSRQVDAVIYTDMYVISRVVFFSGMLFIWPFLSNIDIYHPRRIFGLLYRLVGFFVVMTVGAIGIMVLSGQTAIRLLLGSNYNGAANIKQLAILAILYKFIFLLITTLILFFIVMRNYWAVILPLILTACIGVCLILVGSSASTSRLVFGLDIASTIALMAGFYGLVRVKPSQIH